MVVAGTVFIAVATAFWQYAQHRQTQLRSLVVPEARRGLQALADGEFDLAREHLGRSVDALDRLGEPFPGEDRYRQAHRELAVAHDLIPRALEDELSALAGHENIVSANLHQKSIVLAAQVRRREAGGWEIGYVAFSDAGPVPFHPDGLALFDNLPVETRPLWIFGARIDAIVVDDGGKRWIRLAPASGVLMTEARLCAELGLLSDAELSRAREEQEQLIRPMEDADPIPGA
jgi:hypothetical protein